MVFKKIMSDQDKQIIGGLVLEQRDLDAQRALLEERLDSASRTLRAIADALEQRDKQAFELAICDPPTSFAVNGAVIRPWLLDLANLEMRAKTVRTRLATLGC